MQNFQEIGRFQNVLLIVLERKSNNLPIFQLFLGRKKLLILFLKKLIEEMRIKKLCIIEKEVLHKGDLVLDKHNKELLFLNLLKDLNFSLKEKEFHQEITFILIQLRELIFFH